MLSFSESDVDLTVGRHFNAKWIGTTDSIRARRRFSLDHVSAVVGKGHDDYAAALAGVKRWDMLRQGWVQVHPEHPELVLGTQLAVTARLGPLWSTSICMITTVEESASRFSVSYGTTTDHIERGEEQFEVSMHDNRDVVFSITAVSRPARWWAWLAYPLVRHSQARFRRGAIKAIKASVKK